MLDNFNQDTNNNLAKSSCNLTGVITGCGLHAPDARHVLVLLKITSASTWKRVTFEGIVLCCLMCCSWEGHFCLDSSKVEASAVNAKLCHWLNDRMLSNERYTSVWWSLGGLCSLIIKGWLSSITSHSMSTGRVLQSMFVLKALLDSAHFLQRPWLCLFLSVGRAQTGKWVQTFSYLRNRRTQNLNRLLLYKELVLDKGKTEWCTHTHTHCITV